MKFIKWVIILKLNTIFYMKFSCLLLKNTDYLILLSTPKTHLKFYFFPKFISNLNKNKWKRLFLQNKLIFSKLYILLYKNIHFKLL